MAFDKVKIIQIKDFKIIFIYTYFYLFSEISEFSFISFIAFKSQRNLIYF